LQKSLVEAISKVYTNNNEKLPSGSFFRWRRRKDLIQIVVLPIDIVVGAAIRRPLTPFGFCKLARHIYSSHLLE